MSGSLPGVRFIDLPDLGAVSDVSSFIAERSGAGRYLATALRDYIIATLPSASFATIAALRGNRKAPLTTAFVSGFWAPGDRAGGNFSVVATDTTSADNGGTIIVDLVGQRWYRDVSGSDFPVTWFGAKGDGATDDTVPINQANLAAAAAGRRLDFPVGTFMVAASGLTQTTSWRGADRTLSVIKALAQTFVNGSILIGIRNQSNFRLERLGIDVSLGIFPPGVGNPGNVFSIWQADACTRYAVRDCAFTGIQAHCLAVSVGTSASFFDIIDCDFEMPVPSSDINQAINCVAGCSFFRIKNCTCNGTGVFADGSFGDIEGCTVIGTKYGAGLASGPSALSSYVRYTNNYVANGSGVDANGGPVNGIECWSPNSIIRGNTCVANAGQGIAVGGSNTIVDANLCVNNGQAGLFAGIGGSGIQAVSIASPATGAFNCIFTNNDCFDTQGGGATQQHGYTETIGPGAAGLLGNTFADNRWNNNASTPVGAMSFITASIRMPRLFGSAVYGPVTVPNGTRTSTVLTINGAAPGDSVTVALQQDHQGLKIFGYISSADTATIIAENATGSSVTLISAPLNAWAEKPPSHASF